RQRRTERRGGTGQRPSMPLLNGSIEPNKARLALTPRSGPGLFSQHPEPDITDPPRSRPSSSHGSSVFTEKILCNVFSLLSKRKNREGDNQSFRGRKRARDEGKKKPVIIIAPPPAYCWREMRLGMDDDEVARTFRVQVEGVDWKFARVRDVPAYRWGLNHYFHGEFKTYLGLWKFQQENRKKLVELGLQC
ncbi:hypothetical protein U1Q18_025845, partial [Sarracenia purpurea var. burkii]